MRERPIEFVVKGSLPPSINKLLRTHWAERHKQALAYGWEMRAAIAKDDINVLKAWRDLGLKLRVTMQVSTPREYDQDNVQSLAKIPLDAMKSMQWIRDDGPAYVQLAVTQQVGKKAITYRIQPI